MLMSSERTRATEVEKNVEAVGCKYLKAVEELETWVFVDKMVALEYFFYGGNPVCVKMLRAWEERGQSVENVKPIFEMALEDEWGDGKGGLKGIHHATFVVARK